MNIAFDFDGTLLQTHLLVKNVVEDCGLKYTDNSCWNLTNYPEKVKNEFRFRIKDNAYMNTLPLHKGVYEYLEFLSKKHEIFIVTARTGIIQIGTKQYIRNFLPFIKSENIYFVEPDESKLSILQEINADIWIDDHPEESIKIQEAGIETYLISNEFTCYNHDMRHKIKNVISHIKEIRV